MGKLFLIFLAGALGGALRGILGIAKSAVFKKELQINWFWFAISVIIAAILGLIAASFFLNDIRLAIISGYAGSDFLEGLISLLLKKKFADFGKKEEQESKVGKLLKEK